MSRMKIYDVPHKGLRNAISQLSLKAGNTNYDNKDEVAALYQLGRAVFSILSIHAHDENEVTLTHLEERLPGASHHDKHDHEELEAQQQQLEDILQSIYERSQNNDTIDGAEFYTRLNDFHSVYLAHMAEEEKETQPLLWQYFTDEELAGHRREIMARNPPETLLTWFRFVIPSQSHNERVGLLRGFKANAPQEFFQNGMQVISSVLNVEEFQKLDKALI